MNSDFVSEVDRKFFANNLLSNEDWDSFDSDFGNFGDFSDILGAGNKVELYDVPADIELPSLDEYTSFDIQQTSFHGDTNPEHSDSSDSGIHGVHIKQEPLSPSLSNCSESSDGLNNLLDFTSSLQPPIEFHNNHSTATNEHSDPAVIVEDSSSPIFIKEELSSPAPAISNTVVLNSSDHIINLTQDAEDVKPVIITRHSSQNNIHGRIVKPHVDVILNSKVKIQPKVQNEKSPTKPATTNQNPKKPLVLSADEFAKLTSQGVLRFKPPAKNVPSNIVSQNTQPQSPVAPLSPPSGGNNMPLNPTLVADTDMKAQKRHQRMIKNRESASLSRIRKKEYLSTLEMRLLEFTAENEKLRQENESLKRKMGSLVYENESLKKSKPGLITTKSTCLMAVLLMVGLNLGSISNLLLPVWKESPEYSLPLVHKGRQLMSLKESNNLEIDRSPFSTKARLRKMQDFMAVKAFSQQRNMSTEEFLEICPTYFNKTESIRLAEELSGWMLQHEEEKKKKIQKKQKIEQKKKWKPTNRLKSALKGEVIGQHMRPADMGYPVKLYQQAVDATGGFFDAIHKRNDTYYVLSFSSDYVLLPAVAHNKTMRPRMSLVMPALTLNKTMQPPVGSIGMMQIDCEVLHTQLIHVDEKFIPPHQNKFNFTGGL